MRAHAPKRLPRRVAGILAAAGFALATPALGVRLGELKAHSALGEPLDVTVALRPSRGEAPVPDCFRLGSARSTDLLVDAGATVAVEGQGPSLRLRLRTRAPIQEPALHFRLNAGCPGGRSSTRDYEIPLSPRIALAKGAAGAAPGEAAGQRSLPGDTLASIAGAIYPRNAAARDAYVEALRAGNPALAGLAPDEPIPDGSNLVLPDLRGFAMGLAPPRATAEPPPAATQAPPASAPSPGREARPPRKAPVPAPAPKPEPRAAPSPAAPPKAAQPAPRPRSGGFELRLSAPEADLTRSRGIDDNQRARLRERLLILDADDQVSALLAMRNSLRQLEGRVAELQLKLSTLPPTAAPATPPAKPPVTAVPPPAPAKPAPPPPAPEPAKPAPPPPAPEPAKPAVPPPAPEPVKAAPEAQPVPAKPAAAPKTAAAGTEGPRKAAAPPAAPARQEDDWLTWALAALGIAAVAAVGALAWRARKRAKPASPAAAPATPVTTSMALSEAEAMMRGGAEAPPLSAEHRVVASSDADLATNVPGADPNALRRRYIEERFPEIASGTIEPGNADSVVKAARLFYEDGALARAVELLQFAVEESPAELKPWLALFEIFRLEGLPGEFAELAGRFRDYHGSSDYWGKVQFIGREIDPQNPLYRDGGPGSLETIAFPAGKPPAPITFDPLAENWLNAPMDFTTDALVASLRSGLLADAAVDETGLVADPMPALKNIEMFNVA